MTNPPRSVDELVAEARDFAALYWNQGDHSRLQTLLKELADALELANALLCRVVMAARTLRDNYGGEAREQDLDALDEALAALDVTPAPVATQPT